MNMFRNRLAGNRTVNLWALSVGIIVTICGIAPQIDLWMSRGVDWKGAYAIVDFDEPFYASYLQSIVDGKPRRSSPYTGVVDNPSAPQQESYLSVQFMATYPMAMMARIAELSPGAAMILLAILSGFLSAIVMFWLVYQFADDGGAAFVGALTVLFSGVLAAGQGNFFNVITGSVIHYSQSLIFLRRTLPAAGFPALFLFIIFVWKFFSSEARGRKLFWGTLSVLCFSFNVFCYFYFWSTAAAWFAGLVILWAIFRFHDLRTNKAYVICLIAALSLPLVPYFVLLQNRSSDVDSALALTLTREPDLWRIPELVSYFTISGFIFLQTRGRIKLSEPKSILMMSLAVVAPIVFNQQLFSGRVLQPFHYEFFCVNYMAVLSLCGLGYSTFKKILTVNSFRIFLLVIAILVSLVGGFDTIFGVAGVRELNLMRDDLIPVAHRIKEISAKRSGKSPPLVMSFDFSGNGFMRGIDIPSLTSQPVLWEIHLTMFPDVTRKEGLERLYRFLYYQNFDGRRLVAELHNKNTYLTYALFGADRTSDLYTGELKQVNESEIVTAAQQYETFRLSFDFENARTPELSILFINEKENNDFDALDRWYERDAGEKIGEYTIYNLNLRDPQGFGKL